LSIIPYLSKDDNDIKNWENLFLEDWEQILKLRSKELKKDGVIICNFGAIPEINKDDKNIKVNKNKFYKILREIIDNDYIKNNKITKEQNELLIIPANVRKKSDVINLDLIKKYNFKILYSEEHHINNVFYEKYLENIKNDINNKENYLKTFSKELVNWRRAFSEFFVRRIFLKSETSNEEINLIVEDIFEKIRADVEKNPDDYSDYFPQILLALQKN
jgi:hypothetical protein